MLASITLADYQSHRKTHIPLGQVTAILGPSGAGKSAVRRAAEMAARNARGTSYVRTGASRCVVVLTDQGEGGPVAVAIKRTAAGRGDLYRITTQGEGGPEHREFTKLAGQVPGEVSQILRLGELNFVGQGADPYLVADTGTGIARALGDLTNVSMVFRAAAEAGRRRKGLDRDAKTAGARLEALREQAKGFAGLDQQLAAIGQAEEAAAQLSAGAVKLGRLRELAGRLEAAETAAQLARQAVQRAAPPDLTRLTRALAKLTRLQDLMCDLHQAEVDAEHLAIEATLADERADRAHAAVHAALVAAGHCPLCGQQVTA
jgi:ABC-type cobalamin/Fe3+-siderophores transport system ATPase subunit